MKGKIEFIRQVIEEGSADIIIRIFHPHTIEDSEKIFSPTKGHQVPSQGSPFYRLSGKDLTPLLTMDFGISGSMKKFIENLPEYTYEYSSDWSYELIRPA